MQGKESNEPREIFPIILRLLTLVMKYMTLILNYNKNLPVNNKVVKSHSFKHVYQILFIGRHEFSKNGKII